MLFYGILESIPHDICIPIGCGINLNRCSCKPFLCEFERFTVGRAFIYSRKCQTLMGPPAKPEVYLRAIMEESRIPTLQSPERAKDSIASHQRLLTCLKASDAKDALTAMEQHMDKIEDILKQMLQEKIK